jgi:hypothetical protein
MNSYPQALSTGVNILWTTRRTCARIIHILISNLTHALASRRGGEPPVRLARSRFLVLLGVLCLTGVLTANPANAVTNTDALKLYAHSRIINYEQFQCFHKLITAESSWRINARNGSHFGLGQMRNEKYRNLDGYRQIDWSIRYNMTRYGSHCNTWRFFEKHGYH